jgi:metal-responsive CopG/Arc/MetJ family transcriptional regulator
MPSVSCEVPQSLLAAVDAIAKERLQSRSDALRGLLLRGLQSTEQQ